MKLPYCCHCGRRWGRLSEAHCAACHEQFSTVANFDQHRMKGECVWPAALYTRNGEPRQRLVERAGGPTWVGFEERPKEAYTPVIVAPRGVR